MQEANHAGKYIQKNNSHSSTAGAESDSNPTAAAPSQTEVTDLNCSVGLECVSDGDLPKFATRHFFSTGRVV